MRPGWAGALLLAMALLPVRPRLDGGEYAAAEITLEVHRTMPQTNFDSHSDRRIESVATHRPLGPLGPLAASLLARAELHSFRVSVLRNLEKAAPERHPSIQLAAGMMRTRKN